MPRRPSGKASRALGVSSTPTPIHSDLSTPASSALPSAYPSESEFDLDIDNIDEAITRLPISALTLDVPITNRPPAARKKAKPFPFMSLPSELRVKIYGYHFAGVDRIVDLDTGNYKRIHKALAILRTCRTVYSEASYYFYSTFTFRLFPTDGRFYKTKKPLLARLKPHQRACITSLELRLGPGWGKPPRSWVVNSALGLKDCVNVRVLDVLVQCDPSDEFYQGFRKADGFYEVFSRNLLSNVLEQMPLVNRLEFDAWPGVKKSGAMMHGLLDVAVASRRKITWGPERGWSDMDDAKDEIRSLTVSTSLVGASGAGILVSA
ncbi:3 exoribonuclease family protein [Pleurostoma richardsiae]|uniref:3 exoribonuclease family protein n=1 Tax=Pleurostoma richardsiae TaxID=41990 RepID=A0AA38VK28_9PEZI|nr:3 exoribonuclease family protein [Pleurostoma richardsiae]